MTADAQENLLRWTEYVEAVREQAFHPLDWDETENVWVCKDHGVAGCCQSEECERRLAEHVRFPGGIVHSIMTFAGADWSVESIVDLIGRAEVVEWHPRHLLNHQLHVRWRDTDGPYADGRLKDIWFDVQQPTVRDLDGGSLPSSCQSGGPVYLAVRAWMGAVLPDAVDLDVELRNLLIALAPHVARDDAIDWEGVCHRAMAVCVGAGSPGDATLPEAVEWLAAELHGPSLQPGNGGPLQVALEAIRLTQEYAQLPAIEGWTWYDTYRRFRPVDADRLREEWLNHRAMEQRRRQGDRRRRWGFGRRRG